MSGNTWEQFSRFNTFEKTGGGTNLALNFELKLSDVYVVGHRNQTVTVAPPVPGRPGWSACAWWHFAQCLRCSISKCSVLFCVFYFPSILDFWLHALYIIIHVMLSVCVWIDPCLLLETMEKQKKAPLGDTACVSAVAFFLDPLTPYINLRMKSNEILLLTDLNTVWSTDATLVADGFSPSDYIKAPSLDSDSIE